MDSLRSTQEMEQLSQRLNNIDVSMSSEVKSIHGNNTHEVLPWSHTETSNNDQGKNRSGDLSGLVKETMQV